MKADIESRLLNQLLDKYERGSAFRAGQPPTRRILLKLYGQGSSDFPYYDIESTERRLQVNEAVRRLGEQNLLGYEWMKGETGHILARIWLEPDAVGRAYEILGRKPKGDLMDEVLLDLLELQSVVTADWAKAFCAAAIARIEASRRSPALVPTDHMERRQLFQVIQALDESAGSEITARVFSMKTLGDSKAFERTIRQRLVSILRQTLEADDDAREEDLLQMVGIVRYPEQFEFRGGLRLETETGITDFSPLKHGSSLSLADLKEGRLTFRPRVNRILTIENRANYFETLARGSDDAELILYHGGQYSPSRKQFFQAIQKAMPPDCTWQHWGDLDYGGFSMLARLRREIDPAIQPWRMDIPTLEKHDHLTASITPTYAERLERLLRQPELADCQPALAYLIRQRLRLEQEALLIEG